MDNRFQTYRQNDMNTSNRGKIVVMLYAGAINFLNKAIVCINENDMPGKGKYIQKAVDIVDELNIALDLKNGGEIATNLRSIYLFLIRYLSQANIENNTDNLVKVISILDRFKTAFDEIISNPDFSEVTNINKKEQVHSSFGTMG